MRNQPLLGGHRPPTSGVPAKVDLMGSARGYESRDGELSFAGSETMLALESGAAKEGMQARLSAAAFCELRWVLDMVPPPDPEEEVSPAVVGSKRRRGQLEDDPMRRETTAEQIMAEMVDVFRKYVRKLVYRLAAVLSAQIQLKKNVRCVLHASSSRS